MQITEMPIPPGSLIAPFAAEPGTYTDCYAVTVPASVDLSAYIAAFYTTWLFRAERMVLRVAARRPSTDAEAHALAGGTADSFAVWTVEGRSAQDILLGDQSGRTKSWLMVSPEDAGTGLFFGSVVVPEPPKKPGAAPRLGPVFDALLGAHKVYSRMLLGASARRVMRARSERRAV